ncbi:hypothetical protein VTL71DRAFT_11043 [Oculimacula yallundae]|uniref:methionyl-tRNA formyltransferase n=1 Tax=Oculimacula yallundae TaxID=86028 RepID=A0ABR4CV59_9HELO
MRSLFYIRPLARKLNVFQLLYVHKSYSTATTTSTAEDSLRKVSKPLRILFCGSDEFSIASLLAVYDEHKRNPEYIKSIDVVCRPGKPAGRSLKRIRDVPIKAFAEEKGLTVHEIDTFTGWELPKPENESINLIIAVSFGLFVPPRILNAVEYGGLNLHPSLLPDYRGPAPLQRMLIKDKGICGVTLQTLDTATFDHGKILDQKVVPYQPGLTTYQRLLNLVTPKAALMLRNNLRKRIFVPPLIEQRTAQSKTLDLTDPKKLNHASKIIPADKRIFWQIKTADEDIPKRFRALGRLWTSALITPTTSKRLILEDVNRVARPEALFDFHSRNQERGEDRISAEIGKTVHFFVEDQELREPILYVEDGGAVIFRTTNKALRVERITIEGQGVMDASKAMKSLKSGEAWTLKRRTDVGKGRTCLFEAVPKSADVKTRGGSKEKDGGRKGKETTSSDESRGGKVGDELSVQDPTASGEANSESR